MSLCVKYYKYSCIRECILFEVAVLLSVGYFCRCLEPDESFAKEQSGLEATCSLLCGMKVNCAILKATGAGKHLRRCLKEGVVEGHPSITSLIKQVIKIWKHQVVESAGSS